NEFAQALHLAKTENLLLLDAENKIIQADHEIAGDYLAERWKLPFGLRKAILMHHNPPFREKYIPPDVLKLICIVNLANTLCKMRKIGFSGNEKITAKDEYVMQWMQIEENDIERFFLEIDKELATSKEFLGIITSTEGEEAAGEASSAMRPAVLLIYKNKERVLMPSLFVKNHGFDCHKLAHEAEQKPFPAYPNLKAVLVDELNSDEIAQLRTQIQKTGLTVPVHPLPLSFNSDEIQSFLESLHS
ncbi:MAG: HDOD domain-containing protein, partial [Candidatus Aureabacteria bacterium]|nr:HDOD domain-containing protein [Candidatus Auribacterota bacterium]